MFINGDEVKPISMKHAVNWIGIYPNRHMSFNDIGFSQISGEANGSAMHIPVHRDKYYIIERYKRSTMYPSFGNEGQ